MAQVVSRWPVTAKARVRSQVIPCEICGGQSGIGTGFSPSISVFPCQYYTGLNLRLMSAGFPRTASVEGLPRVVRIVTGPCYTGRG